MSGGECLHVGSEKVLGSGRDKLTEASRATYYHSNTTTCTSLYASFTRVIGSLKSSGCGSV